MKVVVRADASPVIGSGHLARCQVLAERLMRDAGAEVLFVCRGLNPDSAQALRRQGASVAVLPVREPPSPDPHGPAHRHWLSVTREADALETINAMLERNWTKVDWVVVDHYALDAIWERKLREHATSVLAIDDLADRSHDVDLLLDQNLRSDGGSAYRALLPDHARLLIGPNYALLRDEFQGLRHTPRPNHVFICFGGADALNCTESVLHALLRPALSTVTADIVVPTQHPQRARLMQLCKEHERFRLHVGHARISKLMAGAALGVGAGGSMTWERCAAGLPSLAVAIANNQRELIAEAARVGAVRQVRIEDLAEGDKLATRIADMLYDKAALEDMSEAARVLCDGRGASRLIVEMGNSR